MRMGNGNDFQTTTVFYLYAFGTHKISFRTHVSLFGFYLLLEKYAFSHTKKKIQNK